MAQNETSFGRLFSCRKGQASISSEIVIVRLLTHTLSPHGYHGAMNNRNNGGSQLEASYGVLLSLFYYHVARVPLGYRSKHTTDTPAL